MAELKLFLLGAPRVKLDSKPVALMSGSRPFATRLRWRQQANERQEIMKAGVGLVIPSRLEARQAAIEVEGMST
ncbi:MAG: hypothetical protein DYG89_24510 [Caldilinea sp. CFX5]|nr:hypothetical protein [Caldilinea sp. CFX5]